MEFPVGLDSVARNNESNFPPIVRACSSLEDKRKKGALPSLRWTHIVTSKWNTFSGTRHLKDQWHSFHRSGWMRNMVKSGNLHGIIGNHATGRDLFNVFDPFFSWYASYFYYSAFLFWMCIFKPFLPIYRWIRLFYKIGIEQFVLNERQCFDIWYVYELRSFFILF